MKLARIITIAMAVVFSTGVALAPWVPVNAEDTKTTRIRTRTSPRRPTRRSQRLKSLIRPRPPLARRRAAKAAANISATSRAGAD